MDAKTVTGEALFELLKQNLRDWQTDRRAYGKKQAETARKLARERRELREGVSKWQSR